MKSILIAFTILAFYFSSPSVAEDFGLNDQQDTIQVAQLDSFLLGDDEEALDDAEEALDDAEEALEDGDLEGAKQALDDAGQALDDSEE